MKSRDPARFDRRMVEVGGTVAAPPIAIPEGCCTPRGAPSGVSSLCGYVAEWRVDHPDEIPPPEDFYRNRDKSDVQRAIARLGSDNNGDLLLAVWAEGAGRHAPGSSIVRLAEALERRGSLSGDEVAALWRETSLAA